MKFNNGPDKHETNIKVNIIIPDEFLGDGPTDCGSLVDGGSSSQL